MRILLDSRMLHNTGIGRYIQSIVIEGIHYSDQITYVMAGDPQQIKQFCDQHFTDDKRKRIEIFPYTPSLYGWREQLQATHQLARCSHIDIIHIPHFNGPWFLPACSVVTVHDLIPFLKIEKQNYIKLAAARKVMRNVLCKAGRVIVISKHTRADLLEMFPDLSLEKKITLIYQGISRKFIPSSPEEVKAFKKHHGLGRYILYVGNRSPHKNLGRLMEAYHRLQADFPDLQLVIAGSCKKNHHEVDLLKRKMGLEDVLEWEGISDRKLMKLYSGAAVLAFPSLYEGFGLPPLEAMACGTAVVVANSSSLPEVVGDAGIYVDPYDVESITGGIRQVMGDSRMQQKLAERGLKRAALFTWENTFRQTLAVYEEVIAEKRSRNHENSFST